MKETRYNFNWRCPKCGKKHTFAHLLKGEKFVITFPKDDDDIIMPHTLAKFICNKCGCEFKIWVEEEEVVY